MDGALNNHPEWGNLSLKKKTLIFSLYMLCRICSTYNIREIKEKPWRLKFQRNG